LTELYTAKDTETETSIVNWRKWN